MKIELAVTGTALPVSLSILPFASIDFGDCVIGEAKKEIVQLRNNSADLPICYAVRKIAHFHSIPTCGFIGAEGICNLFLSFQPNQAGTLRNDMYLDIIGQVCELEDNRQPVFRKVVLQTVKLHVCGNCPLSSNQNSNNNNDSSRNVQSTKLLPTMSLTNADNQTSQEDFLEKKSTSMKTFHSKETVDQHSSVSLHQIDDHRKNQIQARIAHPDDRACSIRPNDPNDIVR